MPVRVACIEIHLWIDPGRIMPETILDATRAIEKILPLNGGDHGEIGECARYAFCFVNRAGWSSADACSKRRGHIRKEARKRGCQHLEACQPKHCRKCPEFGDGERRP